jgi:phosphatidate cytidylyltransferase
VEGFIGGIAGAAVLGLIYGLVFGKNIPSLAMPAAGCTLICGIGALIAVVGDLAASAIKRDAQIKDYGKLIPGHGGILDRFDSILFTAPAVFILAVLLGA